MTQLIINRLATMLGAPVPAYYLAALRKYPAELRTAMRAIDDSDSEGTVAQVEFPESLEVVLALNEEARADLLVDPDGNEADWPPYYMIIGESGSGDYYCIDAEGKLSGVWKFDHHAVQFEDFAESLDEFIEVLVDTFCDADDRED